MDSFDLFKRHQVNVVVLLKVLFRKLTMKFLCSENGNPGISQIHRRRKTFRQTNTNRESTASYIAPASATNMSSAHFCPQHFKHRLRGCCGTTRAGQRHLNVEAAEDDGATSSPKPNRMIKIMVASGRGPSYSFQGPHKEQFFACSCVRHENRRDSRSENIWILWLHENMATIKLHLMSPCSTSTPNHVQSRLLALPGI